MIHLTLKGTPYEIGYQHGKQLMPLVDGIMKSLSKDYMMKRNIYEMEAKKVLKNLEKRTPEIIEELYGIADGAAVDFMRLLYVNIKYLTYCTVVSFEDSEDGPILGKNMDFPGYAFQVLFTIIPDKGNPIAHIGCAGTVSSYGGINSKGLAMGHSVVFLYDDSLINEEGIPLSFLRRLALQHQNNTEDAIKYLSEIPCDSNGDNIVFLDKNGNGMAIEKSPFSHQLRYSSQRCIYSSNTFTHDQNAHLVDYKEEAVKRYENLSEIIRLNNQPLNNQFLKSILSQREGSFPICRKTTQLSYVVYPNKLMMEVSDGLPYVNGYNDHIISLLDIEK